MTQDTIKIIFKRGNEVTEVVVECLTGLTVRDMDFSVRGHGFNTGAPE